MTNKNKDIHPSVLPSFLLELRTPLHGLVNLSHTAHTTHSLTFRTAHAADFSLQLCHPVEQVLRVRVDNGLLWIASHRGQLCSHEAAAYANQKDILVFHILSSFCHRILGLGVSEQDNYTWEMILHICKDWGAPKTMLCNELQGSASQGSSSAEIQHINTLRETEGVPVLAQFNGYPDIIIVLGHPQAHWRVLAHHSLEESLEEGLEAQEPFQCDPC